MLNQEFVQALLNNGIDPSPMLQLWDDAQGVILREEDVGAIIAAHAPGLDLDTLKKLSSAVFQQTTPIQRVFSTMLAAYLGERVQRPNTFVTLYAHDVGDQVAPGGPYPLRPRKRGSLEADYYTITATQSFLRCTSNQIDITNGFSLVGDNFGLEGDKPKPFDSDVSLAGFLHDAPIESTPLASWLGRSPKQNKRFVADVMLDSAADQTYTGLILALFDSACRAVSALESAWGPILGDFDFGSAGQSLMNALLARKAMMPSVQAAPTTTTTRPMIIAPGLAGRLLGR